MSAAGLAPPPCTALTRFVAASYMRANASPPIPVLVGSHTFRAAATATAASPAVPPFRRISIPAAVARFCEDATIPRVLMAHARRLLNSMAVVERAQAAAPPGVGASGGDMTAPRTRRKGVVTEAKGTS